MNRTKARWNSILWIEATGFSTLIILSWITEAARIPHFIFGEAFSPNWHRSALRSIVILIVWLSVHRATRRLLERLHYLEDFMRMCSWCRKINCDGEWVPIEQFLSSQFSTRTTHGMCPECHAKGVRQLESLDTGPTPPAA